MQRAIKSRWIAKAKPWVLSKPWAFASNGDPITIVTAAEPQPKCSPLTKAKVTINVYKGINLQSRLSIIPWKLFMVGSLPNCDKYTLSAWNCWTSFVSNCGCLMYALPLSETNLIASLLSKAWAFYTLLTFCVYRHTVLGRRHDHTSFFALGKSLLIFDTADCSWRPRMGCKCTIPKLFAPQCIIRMIGSLSRSLTSRSFDIHWLSIMPLHPWPQIEALDKLRL